MTCGTGAVWNRRYSIYPGDHLSDLIVSRIRTTCGFRDTRRYIPYGFVILKSCLPTVIPHRKPYRSSGQILFLLFNSVIFLHEKYQPMKNDRKVFREKNNPLLKVLHD